MESEHRTTDGSTEATHQQIEGISSGFEKMTLNPPSAAQATDRISTTTGDEEAVLSSSAPYSFTPFMESTLETLRKLQANYDSLEKEYMTEWNALKLRYLEKFRPLYASRCEAICQSPPDVTEDADPPATPALPNFWLHALKNHRIIAALIQDADEPILRYLKDIKSEWLDDKEQTSFKLSFHFTTNPYFTHDILTKCYHMERDEDDGGGILLSTEGTDIKWQPGKDPTKVVVTKRQRNSKTKQTRVIKETQKRESFFDFFNSFVFPAPEEFERLDRDEAKRIEFVLEDDFDTGCIIREKILPRALGWFMGEEDDEISDESEEDSDESDGEDPDSDDDDEADSSGAEPHS